MTPHLAEVCGGIGKNARVAQIKVRQGKKFLFVVLFLLCVGIGHAGPQSYQCEIKEGWSVGDNGMLEPYPLERYFMKPGELAFAIDRTTGVIIGGPLATREYVKPEVLDRGGPSSYFKLLLRIDEGNYSLLFVREFADRPIKPFYANDSNLFLLYNGLCR